MTVPSRWAVTVVSIFIASSTSTGSPSADLGARLDEPLHHGAGHVARSSAGSSASPASALFGKAARRQRAAVAQAVQQIGGQAHGQALAVELDADGAAFAAGGGHAELGVGGQCVSANSVSIHVV